MAAPGFHSPRSLRSHGSFHPYFCKPWKPTVSFIGLAKTSYTAETLVEEAFKFSQTVSTKRGLIETALKEYVNNRKRKSLKEPKGKIKFSADYDYKK
jgi:hypothetical protein